MVSHAHPACDAGGEGGGGGDGDGGGGEEAKHEGEPLYGH